MSAARTRRHGPLQAPQLPHASEVAKACNRVMQLQHSHTHDPNRMIYIAIGANLPAPDGTPPLQTCRAAAAAVAALPGLRLAHLSTWHETAPVPPSGQPNYVNGVIALQGAADPAQLLQSLQSIEARFGRIRGEPNAARRASSRRICVSSRC